MQNCSVNIVPVRLSCVSVSQPVVTADQFIDISWWQWSPFLADDIAWDWKQSFTRNSCGRGREIFASQWDNGRVGTRVRRSSAWASAAFYPQPKISSAAPGRQDKYDPNHCKRQFDMLIDFSLVIKMLWSTRSKTEGLEWGWRRELGSWFQRQGEV